MLQIGLVHKAQFPQDVFPVHFHPRTAPGAQHSPGSPITHHLPLYPKASAAPLVTRSVSACFPSCSPHHLALPCTCVVKAP